MVGPKNAFWQALVFSIMIFIIGFILGLFLEIGRTEQININLINSEINLLDEQLRNKLLEDIEIDCKLAKKSAFEFADRIYEEAQKLEEYDAASTFTDTLKVLHRRYDLLRLILWTESIKIKEKCGSDFHTIIYFFEYDIQNIEKRAKQTSLSRLLIDIKEENPDEILLIPIASN